MSPSGDPSQGPSLTEGQNLLREELRRFCEEEIRPGVADRDRSHTFPREILHELGQMGLLGMTVAEEYGGTGLDALDLVIVIEEIARVCPSVAVSLSVSNSVCCWPISRFGTQDLKRKVLPILASGTSLGGFALTEPGSGSDAAALQTRAVRDGDDWILNGEKAWITNAGAADFYVVFARTGPAADHRGISAFVVPSDASGLNVGEQEEKLGLRASLTAPLFFQDCRVPAELLLGEPGQGFKIALATLDHSRLGIAAQAVGIHQRALELAIDYAESRVQFGQPIARFQGVAFPIADIATRLAAARALCRAAAAAEGSADAGRLAAQAKLFAAEAANRACWDCLQIHGGNGFSEEYEIARLYRDVRVTTIYEGTSEMQRRVIARHLLQ